MARMRTPTHPPSIPTVRARERREGEEERGGERGEGERRKGREEKENENEKERVPDGEYEKLDSMRLGDLCHHCKKPGHYVRNCKESQDDEQMYRRGPRKHNTSGTSNSDSARALTTQVSNACHRAASSPRGRASNDLADRGVARFCVAVAVGCSDKTRFSINGVSLSSFSPRFVLT
jgi:hypothetical protein